MRKLESPQQEEFGNVAKTQFVAQATQQNLEHDIGGHLDEIEGCASPFIKGAMTILALKHRIAQVRYPFQASRTSQVAMRAIHK